MISDRNDTIQQVHRDRGRAVPIFHLDQVAGAIVEEASYLTIVIANLTMAYTQKIEKNLFERRIEVEN